MPEKKKKLIIIWI